MLFAARNQRPTPPSLILCQHGVRPFGQAIDLTNDVAQVRARGAQNVTGVRNCSADATACALFLGTPETGSRSISAAKSLSSNASNRPELTKPPASRFIRPSITLLSVACALAVSLQTDVNGRRPMRSLAARASLECLLTKVCSVVDISAFNANGGRSARFGQDSATRGQRSGGRDPRRIDLDASLVRRHHDGA